MAKASRTSTAEIPIPRATLTSVKLERFKAAFKPDPVELHPFTVIVGRNGSGKSTFLEALQWVDVTMRRDAGAACDRYLGIKDLLNLRSAATPGYFSIHCEWQVERQLWTYDIKVEEDSDHSTARITTEELRRGRGKAATLVLEGPDSSDRLLLARESAAKLLPIRDFWRRAVFLRLNPSSLAEGSLLRRASQDPLLDEEGKTLPALLHELTSEQRERLVAQVKDVLPGMRGVEVSTPGNRSERVHYELVEEMKYRGRSGKKKFPIPAWMLSEGTRRLTALIALLVREPPASLLCVEEIENGLDPWAVRILLRYLRDASERGTQIVVTTHSPWVLDADAVALDDIVLVQRNTGHSEYKRFAEIPAVQAFDADVLPGTRYTHLEEHDV